MQFFLSLLRGGSSLWLANHIAYGDSSPQDITIEVSVFTAWEDLGLAPHSSSMVPSVA